MLVSAGYFVYKKYLRFYVRDSDSDSAEEGRPLQVPQYEKDKVYLIQVPVSPEVRSISPYALKLETWLRLSGIPFESRYSLVMNERQQTPYIEYNGKPYPDTNLIIDFLKEEFVVDPDQDLSKEDRMLTHLIRTMIESHLANIGFYWRYALNYPEFLDKTVDTSDFPRGTVPIMKFIFPLIASFKGYLSGISRCDAEEMNESSFKDLKVISNYLKDKKYFFGGESASTVDCIIFGHLAQFLFIPMDFPQKPFLRKECPNLVEHVNRIKEEFWPDWEEMCDEKCMKGKKGLSPF